MIGSPTSPSRPGSTTPADTALEFIGGTDAGGRSVHLLVLAKPELPEFRLPSTHFTCLVAADFGDPASAKLLQALMKKGAAHFTGWGPGSGRVASTVQAEDCPVPWPVKAIWFERDPLSKAVRAFLTNRYPDDVLDRTCRSSLAVVVGNPKWAAEVRRWLVEGEEAAKPKAPQVPLPTPVMQPLAIPRPVASLPASSEPYASTVMSEPAANEPIASEAAASASRPDSGPICRPPAEPGERELCQKLLLQHGLSGPERQSLPGGRARFSVIREVVAEVLSTSGWFPLRLEEMQVGVAIESREGQIWVHEQAPGSTEVRSRRVTSVSDAVRAYIRCYGDPGGGSIDGVVIDLGA